MTTSPTPDRVTAIYDAIDAFQREHRTVNGLAHAQIRGLLAEHLDRALPAVVSPPPATRADDRAALRDRIAEALREHYLCTNRDEADADGNLPCRCGDWREPGAEADDENDWDSHLADAALAVLPPTAPCSCRTNPTLTAQIGYPVRCPHCPPDAGPVPPTHWTKHVQRHHPEAARVLPPPADRAAELASLAVNSGRALRDEKRHYEIACQENARLRATIERVRRLHDALDAEAQPEAPTGEEQPATETPATYTLALRYADALTGSRHPDALAWSCALRVGTQLLRGGALARVAQDCFRIKFGIELPAAEAQQQPATETRPESCAHCGKNIRCITGTLTRWWVHEPGGHTVCFPEHAAASTRATPKPAVPVGSAAGDTGEETQS